MEKKKAENSEIIKLYCNDYNIEPGKSNSLRYLIHIVFIWITVLYICEINFIVKIIFTILNLNLDIWNLNFNILFKYLLKILIIYIIYIF